MVLEGRDRYLSREVSRSLGVLRVVGGGMEYMGTGTQFARVFCAPGPNVVVCVYTFEVYTGAATQVLWVRAESRDSASHSSSGRSFGLVLLSARAHTCTIRMRCVST